MCKCVCVFVFYGLNRGLHSRDVMVSPTSSRPCSVAVRKQTFSPALFLSLPALSLISLVHPKLIELQFPHIPSAPLPVASACLTGVKLRPSLDCNMCRHNGFATLNEGQHMKDGNAPWCYSSSLNDFFSYDFIFPMYLFLTITHNQGVKVWLSVWVH